MTGIPNSITAERTARRYTVLSSNPIIRRSGVTGVVCVTDVVDVTDVVADDGAFVGTDDEDKCNQFSEQCKMVASARLVHRSCHSSRQGREM